MNQIQNHTRFLPDTTGAYLVGGCVRDLLLYRSPVDYDIAVLENPEEYAHRLAQEAKGRVVKLGKPGMDILRVIIKGATYDISPVHGGSIETDLGRRDFTINAIAYDLGAKKIIDPFGGRNDLSKQTVRMVSGTIFDKDPVRLLRAHRINAGLGFTIDPATLCAISENARLIRLSAPERVREELLRLFEADHAHGDILAMGKNGLLFAVVPEIEKLCGCLQNLHHEYDVYTHTLEALKHLEYILAGSPPAAGLSPENLKRVRGYTDRRKTALLKWGLLLHDVGKPLAKTYDGDGNIHFYGHARTGAMIAGDIARRLRFSNRDITYADLVIRHHMQPLFLFAAEKNGRLTGKGLFRFFHKCGFDTPGVLLHALADVMAKGKKSGEGQNPFFRFIDTLMAAFFSDYCADKAHPPLITGEDLIKEIGLSPSPLFKTLLSRVEEAQMMRRIRDRAEALQFIRQLLTSIHP